MTFDTGWYTEWFAWYERRGLQLSRQNPIGFAVYLAEGSTALNALVGDFETVAGLFRGNVFAMAVRLAKFAKDTPDPLASGRQAMRAMRAKYGEVTTTPAPAVAPAPAGGSAS